LVTLDLGSSSYTNHYLFRRVRSSRSEVLSRDILHIIRIIDRDAMRAFADCCIISEVLAIVGTSLEMKRFACSRTSGCSDNNDDISEVQNPIVRNS